MREPGAPLALLRAPAPPADQPLVPLSLSQQSAVVRDTASPDNGFLNWVYLLSGVLDVPLLVRSINDAVEDYPIVRSRFVGSVGPGDAARAVREMAQYPMAAATTSVDVVDVDAAGIGGVTDVIAHARAAFESLTLVADPRLRATIYTMGPKRNILALFVSQGLVDSASSTTFAAEISDRYRAYLENGGRPTPRDEKWNFLEHLATTPPCDTVDADLAHWEKLKQHYGDIGTWPRRDTGTLSTELFKFGPAEWGRIVTRARELGAMPYVLCLASLKAALNGLAGAEEFLIASGVALRDHGVTEEMIGCFYSCVRVQARVSRSDRLGELVTRTIRAMHDAVTHSAVPATLLDVDDDWRREYWLPHTVVAFYMFGSRAGMNLSGVRQRRYRMITPNEVLRVNCALEQNGDCGFFFSTSCAPPELLGQLAENFRTVLRTFTTTDLADVGQVRLEKIH
jgi:condensation domain-containing protein